MSIVITLPSRVKVTRRHIGAGKPRDCCECPIALAVIEAVRAAGISDAEVSVTLTIAVVRAGERKWVANLPGEAQAFIERIDNELPVRPFALDLEWVEVTAA